MFIDFQRKITNKNVNYQTFKIIQGGGTLNTSG